MQTAIQSFIASSTNERKKPADSIARYHNRQCGVDLFCSLIFSLKDICLDISIPKDQNDQGPRHPGHMEGDTLGCRVGCLVNQSRGFCAHMFGSLRADPSVMETIQILIYNAWNLSFPMHYVEAASYNFWAIYGMIQHQLLSTFNQRGIIHQCLEVKKATHPKFVLSKVAGNARDFRK